MTPRAQASGRPGFADLEAETEYTMNVQRFDTPDAAAEAAKDYAIRVLEEALAGHERATFAVSGGSTPKLLFQKLAGSGFHWDRVHLFWVDERCVPPTDAASNYKLTADNLIRPAQIPPSQVHRIAGEIDPHEAARRYADEIREFFQLKDGEMPRFDLLHRGMGPDAHTASLFPGEPLIDDHTNLTAAVYAPQFQQWRVTLLSGPLAAAKHTLFLVAGQDKAEPLRAVFEEPYNPRKYPSQIAARDAGTNWILDAEAARLLK